MQIIIYGAPGAGKTSTSRLLHNKNGIELYEGDYLREVKLPREVGDSKDPFLYIGTKQAWRLFGDLNKENVIKGLQAVRKSMQPYIDKELAERPSVIFEAAFLDPTSQRNGRLFLVVTAEEAAHREQFYRDRKFFHPKYGSAELEEGFLASRLIQDYLIEEAKKLKVTVIYNNNNQNELLDQFDNI